jgi:hypothetical protein
MQRRGELLGKQEKISANPRLCGEKTTTNAMHYFRFILLPAFACLTVLLSAQTTPKSPDEFLPHRIGEQFTPHHLLTDYFEYLAANTPTTMRLERYGATNEARPLQVAYFSSPENIAQLEQIRLNNLRLAGAAPTQKGESAVGGAAIVWLSMSVHGNEPSGSECSMLLAWELATQPNRKCANG